LDYWATIWWRGGNCNKKQESGKLKGARGEHRKDGVPTKKGIQKESTKSNLQVEPGPARGTRNNKNLKESRDDGSRIGGKNHACQVGSLRVVKKSKDERVRRLHDEERGRSLRTGENGNLKKGTGLAQFTKTGSGGGAEKKLWLI